MIVASSVFHGLFAILAASVIHYFLVTKIADFLQTKQQVEEKISSAKNFVMAPVENVKNFFKECIDEAQK